MEPITDDWRRAETDLLAARTQVYKIAASLLTITTVTLLALIVPVVAMAYRAAFGG